MDTKLCLVIAILLSVWIRHPAMSWHFEYPSCVSSLHWQLLVITIWTDVLNEKAVDRHPGSFLVIGRTASASESHWKDTCLCIDTLHEHQAV